jgi:hypothetical protein
LNLRLSPLFWREFDEEEAFLIKMFCQKYLKNAVFEQDLSRGGRRLRGRKKIGRILSCPKSLNSV